MDLTTLIALAVLLLMLPGAVLIWFVVFQLRKTRELLDRLRSSNRMRRIRVSKHVVHGTVLLFINSDEEHGKAPQAVDIQSELTLQLSRSTLAL